MTVFPPCVMISSRAYAVSDVEHLQNPPSGIRPNTIALAAARRYGHHRQRVMDEAGDGEMLCVTPSGWWDAM